MNWVGTVERYCAARGVRVPGEVAGVHWPRSRRGSITASPSVYELTVTVSDAGAPPRGGVQTKSAVLVPYPEAAQQSGTVPVPWARSPFATVVEVAGGAVCGGPLRPPATWPMVR